MDIELLQQEIKDLKKQVTEKDSIIKMNQKDADARALKIHQTYQIRDLLRGVKTTYDEASPDAKEALVHALLSSELRSRDAEFYLDDNDNFKLRNIDGSTFLSDNHQQVTPASFLEKVLTDNKILAGKSNAEENSENRKDEPEKYSRLKELVKESREAFAAGTDFNPLA